MPSDRRLGRARELGGAAREILQRLCDDLFFKCARRAALCRSYVVETQNGAKHARRRTFFHESPDAAGKTLARSVKEDICDLKLNSQRNWIAKNPVRITRAISNCYENSRAVIESLFEKLQPALNAKMRPKIYGCAINYIKLCCAFSFDDEHCRTNYIIAPDKPRLSSQRAWELIHEMMSEEQRRAGGYYLRNRFEYSPFRKDTGKTGALIHFEPEFSELPSMEQKRKMGEYFLTALKQIAQKQSKLEYDFTAMIEDFGKILGEWTAAEI